MTNLITYCNKKERERTDTLCACPYKWPLCMHIKYLLAPWRWLRAVKHHPQTRMTNFARSKTEIYSKEYKYYVRATGYVYSDASIQQQIPPSWLQSSRQPQHVHL